MPYHMALRNRSDKYRIAKSMRKVGEGNVIENVVHFICLNHRDGVYLNQNILGLLSNRILFQYVQTRSDQQSVFILKKLMLTIFVIRL